MISKFGLFTNLTYVNTERYINEQLLFIVKSHLEKNWKIYW